MIEFTGYLSGRAEKQFWKKSNQLFLKLFLCVFVLMTPIIIFFSIKLKLWIISGIFVCVFGLFMLIPIIPKSKKEKQAMLPKRIFTDGESIVCIADKYADTKMIANVKQVYDFDEFYDLVFYANSVSEKYICQKDLLTQGTLAEFEALFEGKIIDMKDRTVDGSLS